MMRRRSMPPILWNAGILAAGFAALLTAQTSGGSFTNFSVQETPNPTAVGQYTTLTASITGTAGLPPGQVEFYISTNTDTCSPTNYAYLIGQSPVASPGTATVNWTPSEYGPAQICATYIPSNGDPYPETSVGPTQFTINQGFKSFDIGGAPSPVGDGIVTTLTAILGGTSQYGVPTGTVQFYISSNSIACKNSGNNISGQLQITSVVNPDGSATYNWAPTYPGTFAICATYTPNSDGDNYATATAGPYLLTVNQPAVLSVSVPAETALDQTLPFTIYLPTPSGQLTNPTGTITLYDPNCPDNGEVTCTSYGLAIGTVTVTGGGVYGPVYAALTGLNYTVVYSGDGNYQPQYYYGTLQLESGLTSISPAAVTPGASTTTTFTLTGLAINSDSNQLVEVVIGDEPFYITPTSFNCSGTCPIPQLQFTIPDTLSVGEASVYLAIRADTDSGYATIGGPVSLQVYNQYTDNVTDSAPPTLAYGAANFTANVSRSVPQTDAAVPAGQVTFSLNGTNGNTYSASVGSAQLSQTSNQGIYESPFLATMDRNGTGKLVAADLNGDGYVDLVGLPAFYYPSVFFDDGAQAPYLQVMLSTGYNAFQTEQQVFTGCEAEDFAVGDINNDNIPDLVVVCFNNSNDYDVVYPLEAYYLLGNGDGTFGPPVPFGGNSYIGAPTNVVLGQFNNDGYLDIAVIDGINGYVQVISPFGNNGNPTYGPQVGFSTSYGQVVTAGAADFNHYGLSDLVLEEYNYNYDSESGTGGALLLLNSYGNLSGFYQQSLTPFSATAYSMQSMTITDVNGDGYPDVVVADPGGVNGSDNGNLLMFENDTYGNLPLTYTYPAANNSGAVAGVPFPTIGTPASSAAAAPGWNLVFTGIEESENDDSGNVAVVELQRQNATQWNVVSTFDAGIEPYYLGDDEGFLPDFIVTGDMNGDGYLDFALNGEPSESEGEDYVLQPWYYSNDAQATLTGSLPSPFPPPGTYNLTASYPGSPVSQLFEPNNGVTQITIAAANPAGILTVNPSSGPYAFGTSLTFNASVVGVTNGAAPSQTVSFYDNGTQFDTENLNIPDGGSTSTAASITSLLAPGTHNICTSYSGDSNYNAVPNSSVSITPSTALECTQVTILPFSLLLTASPGSSTAGTVVTFQVSGNGVILPAGQTVTLNITVNAVPAVAPVNIITNASGTATYNYGLLPPGTYSIQATFTPFNSEGFATSNTVSLPVGQTPVIVDLASSASPVPYPTAINLAAVAGTSGLGVPTGAISFQNNGSTLPGGSDVALFTVNGTSGLASVGTIDAVTGQTVIGVATGDFNGDHNQDLAVLESGSGSASLLISLGNGDGTFQAPTIYSSTEIAGFDPSSVAIAAADFNGDGYTDLVVAASDGAIAVILAAGDAAGDLNILQAQLIQTPYAPLAVATGDFNKDGNQDFVVIGTNNVTAFYGTGSTPSNFPTGGSWTNPNPSNSSNFTGITVADFNQDGYADFAISDNSVPDVAVFLYNSDGGGFSGPSTYPVGVSATAIASGSITGDGYPDLAVASSTDSTVAVLINFATTNGNSSKGTFGPASIYGVASVPTAVAMNDFNQDGYADIAVTGTPTGAAGGTSILLGSSSGAMWGETLLPGFYGQAIASTDFNNDGNPDLAVGYSNGGTVFLDQYAQAILDGVVLPAGTNPLTGVYTPSDSSTFAGTTSNTVSEVVSQTTPAISWSSPSAIPYGTLLGTTQLNASAPVPGTFTYAPAPGTQLSAGTHQLSVTFTPNDPSYLGSTATVSITVNQVASTITWAGPAAIPYGTALGTTQLNATASVAGTFTYTPVPGTVLPVGTRQLFVDFVPNDTLDYLGATSSVTITVTPVNPIAALTPSPAAFTNQVVGTTSVPMVFTLLNSSSATASLSISNIALTGANPTDFAITPGTNACSTSVAVAINSSCNIYVTFTPGSDTTFGATLTVTDNATPTSQTSALSGTGVTFVSDIGTAEAAQTVTVAITKAGTINNIQALTLGQPNLDFTLGAAPAVDACATDTAYTVGEACTVNVIFTPAYAGTRKGAVLLTDVNNDTLGIVGLPGIGNGPQVIFGGGTQKVLGGGFAGPQGVSVDAIGNVYVADQGDGDVKEIPLSCINGANSSSCVNTLATGFVYPIQVKLDGAGDIFFADYAPNTSSGDNLVEEIPYGCTSSSCFRTVGSGFKAPSGVAVDINGDVLVSDWGNNKIKEVQALGGVVPASPNIKTLFTLTGPDGPDGMTVDFNGNVYLADHNNGHAAYQLTAASGYTTLNTLSNGFTAPEDVELDGTGNAYVVDEDATSISEILAVNGSIPASPTILTLGSGFNSPEGVAVDGRGNVYVGDQNNSRVVELDYADPPSLNFPTATYQGLEDTTDSPQTVTVTNNGNEPLIFNTISASTNFSIDAGTTTCFTSSQLAAGASCVVGVDFAPTAGGALHGTLTLTDNALNVVGTTQSIPLSGVGIAPVASTISWPNPSAIPYGTALSGSQLNATASVPGTFTYTPALGTILIAGTHQLSVSFAPTDTSAYLSATASVSITVSQVASTITWPGPATIPYGTALSGVQLNASSSVPGTLLYTPALGAVLTAGPHTLFVSFTPTDTLDYLGATSSVSINVSQVASAISWPNPSAIAYGTALGSTQLNATASVPGTFQYTPAAGTVLNAGTRSLVVDFTPNDALDYTSTTATVSITVNKVATTVTWSNPAAIAYGTPLSGAQLNATASVPGTFTYSPALGTVLTAGPHTLAVTFTPSDSVDYQTATSSVSISVSQAASAISWSNPAAITYGTALSGTQLNATASVPGTFAYSPALGTVLSAGPQTLSVTFTPTDSVDYSVATAGVSIAVNQATPTITWTAPAAITFGTPLSAAQLSATASTAGTLSYNPLPGTVLSAGSHTLNVRFTPNDSSDYAATSGFVSIQVNQATPVITWANPAAISYGTPLGTTQLNATATPPGGAFTYTPPAGTTLPAGTQTLNVTYMPTDTTDYATVSSTVTVLVNPALALSSILPTSGSYGRAATTITLNGTGFALNTIVQLNGTTIASSFISPTQMTAVIPASFFEQTQPGAITVTNPSSAITAPSVPFTVTLPNVLVTFSGPGSASPAQQPNLNLEFLEGYPLPVEVTLTLTVQPATTGGPVDPAVQFSTGGTTLTIPLPANSTTVPAIQIQTGTLAATITVTLTLESGGLDVTPAGLQPVVITVPAVVPVISSATLTRSGNTLTVTIQGYSSTRDISSAVFTFTPIAGGTIDDPQVTVDVSTDFSSWFTQEASDQYGGAFSYTQTFNLSNDSANVASVSVTLTNSVGTSNTQTAQ